MEAHAASSPLVTARLRRRLTLEEAAELTSLELDDIKSLEESRTYRFPTTTDAIATISPMVAMRQPASRTALSTPRPRAAWRSAFTPGPAQQQPSKSVPRPAAARSPSPVRCR